MTGPDVIAIFGPTGIGKTAVAVALAEMLRGGGERPVAIGADALQLYRGIETLTGAADERERAMLEHRLVGSLPVTATSTAAAYAAHAHREIDALLAEGATPIVVGGTGLYLVAAVAGLSFRPPPGPGVRERLSAELEAAGAPAMHARLAALDPGAAARTDVNDRHRIVRALELLEAGDRPPGGEELWTRRPRHPTLLAGLVMERGELRARIDARVDAMVAAGAAAEVRAAHAAGASATARRALGFDELLAGDVEAMKLRTRQYARRQLTWMRKLPADAVLDVTGRTAQDVAAELLRRAGRQPAAARGR